MPLLAGKTAIVTGAGSGIGKAAALLFAREGAKLVLNGRRESEIAAVASEIAKSGGEAVFHAGSVSDERTASTLVSLAKSSYGRLDIAFNNAGVMGEAGPSAGVSKAGFEDALAINLTGSFLGAKHQIPAMLETGGGSVIFTSTFIGHTASFPGIAAYAASKSGLIGLTQALAVEFGPQGVRVNALLPGAVDTPMYRGMNNTEEAQGFVKGLHALKRAAEPIELANAALFLASGMSSFMTGEAMIVDGGASVNRT
jgi:NAD(P)-dependent dehydrogenase (short-subunit alcohol dehydrogenase family)